MPQKYQDFEYCIDNQTQILIKNNQLVYRFVERHDKEWLEEEENGIKSDEEEEREKEKFKPTYQYVELNWLNSNPNAKIEIEDLSQVKYGYAIDWEDTKKGRTLFCKGYKKLIIKNLYEGIDAEYFFTEKEGEIKYNLVVQPSANINQIKFRYEGANQNLVSGNIIVETLKGALKEYAPVSFIKSTS